MRKRPEISEFNRRRLDRLIPIGMALVFVAIPVLGSEHDPWYEFLKSWQTLATGVLAIIAACLTVQQMHQSDQNQEERHRQLVTLALRRDALVVLRACVPLSQQLLDWADETKNRMDRILVRANGVEVDWPNWDDVDGYSSKSQQIADLVFSEHLKRAMDLLDPVTTQVVERLLERAGPFSEKMPNFLERKRREARQEAKRRRLEEEPDAWVADIEGVLPPINADDLDTIRSRLADTPSMIEDARSLGERLKILLAQYRSHADISKVLDA